MNTLTVKYYDKSDNVIEFDSLSFRNVFIIPNIGDAVDYKYSSTRYYVTAKDLYYSEDGSCHVIVKAKQTQ